MPCGSPRKWGHSSSTRRGDFGLPALALRNGRRTGAFGALPSSPPFAVAGIGAGPPPLRWAWPRPVVVPADEPCAQPPDPAAVRYRNGSRRRSIPRGPVGAGHDPRREWTMGIIRALLARGITYFSDGRIPPSAARGAGITRALGGVRAHPTRLSPPRVRPSAEEEEEAEREWPGRRRGGAAN